MSGFVDTNIFIRLLTGDDPAKAARSLALFQRAQQGETTLFTSEAVIAEIVYVLTSRSSYGLPREAVAANLQPLLALPGLRIDHKGTVLSALDLWVDSNLAFVDCLAIEHTRRIELEGIYSYDRGLDRVEGVRRLEP